MLTAHSCSTYFSLFLCGIDTSPFPRKTLSCMRGVPLLFLSCEGAQRLQSVKDRRPDVVGGKGVVSVQCILKATGSGAASSSLESRRLRRFIKTAPAFARIPPQARWNRGDCGPPTLGRQGPTPTASSSLESRRLRRRYLRLNGPLAYRLKLAGIAATAAGPTVR